MNKTIYSILFLNLILFTPLFSQNNSLSFDGSNDFVFVPDNNSLDLSSNMTIEFWIYLESSSGQEVLSKSVADDNENFRIYIDPSNNSQIYFDYGNKYCQTHSLPITTSEWYHMTFSVSAENQGTIYVNGIEATTYSVRETAEATIPTNNHILEIGGCSFTERYFDGKLDELRIWNDIRTETEIRQNMYRELLNPSGETNLAAYYPLNETSGTTANDSKGSNNGTLTNYGGQSGYWQTSPAMFGPKNCLDFDGSNDYVSINNLKLSGSEFTLETWVYLREFGTPSGDANIANLFRGGDENVVLRIGDGDQPNDMPQFVINVGGHQRLNANARLELNTWYHLAGVYDGSTMKLYINGKLDKSQGQTGSIATTNNSFGFGGPSRNLNGQMDEMRIWEVARSAEQIRENMCKNLTGNEAGLLAYYPADNVNGTTLPDLSNNSYDGSLTDMNENSDWVNSSAFNIWLNTSSSSWTVASNWSRGSVPVSTDNTGIFSYTGGTNPAISNSDEAIARNMVIDLSNAWNLSGSFNIQENLITESDINLNGKTITLGSDAYLIEDAGRIYGNSGSITTTRNLSNINENIAGLGAEITTSANMGSTTISRNHSSATNPQSIERRYSISPTNNSGLNASLCFHYNENELNGLTESNLELSRSTNGGTSWTDKNGSVNTFYNTISLSGIDAFSLWTATESEDVSPPILETENPIHDYTTGNAAFFIAPNTTVTTSSNIENATVSISPIVSEDVLTISSLPSGLSQSWDNSTKILSITGSGSASDYQTALRNVKFESTSNTEETRTIDFILGEGIGLMIDGEQHYYEVIDNGSYISWTNARTNALTSRFGSAQGYLATVTSESENNYLAEKVTADTWIGATDSEQEGVWKWMDGPEAGTYFWLGDVNAGNSSTTNYGSAVNGEYSNWNTNEPNNAFGSYGEDCAHMYGSNSGQPGYWNDYYSGHTVQYYIVEYGGDGSNFTTIDNATIVVNGVNWTGDIDSDWNNAGNWSSNSIPDANTDIMIPNVTNDPVVNAGIGANCNNLSISAGAVLTIESDGSLITNGNISNSGTINIKRTMSQGQWHMVSSPISDGLSGVFDGDFLQTFNEEDDWWYEISSTDTELTPVKGYGVWSNGSSTKTYTFSGTPNTGDQSISLTAQGSGGSHNRANLVGNPYPSSIDWNSVSGYGAKYTWNGTAYEAYPAEDGYGVGARYAAPMQGFFIIPASSGTFTLTNDNRTHSGANGFEKSSKELKNGLVLFTDNGDYQDKLVIVFNEESYDYFEQEKDAWKILSNVEGLSQIYTLANDKKLSIDNRPETEMIQLGFHNDANGNYSIGVTEMDGIAKAEVEDTKLNHFHDLTKGAYTFNWQTTDSEERFILHLKATGIDDLDKQAAQVYAANGLVYLRLDQPEDYEQLQFIDLSGRLIAEYPLQQHSLQSFDYGSLDGAYLIRLIGKKKTITKKVILR